MQDWQKVALAAVAALFLWKWFVDHEGETPVEAFEKYMEPKKVASDDATDKIRKASVIKRKEMESQTGAKNIGTSSAVSKMMKHGAIPARSNTQMAAPEVHK